jgi:ABC-type nitrate/sulfonate/bicarbonate transport system substrate-binding protein
MNNQYFNLKRLLLAGIFLLGVPALVFGSWSCQKGYSGTMESVTLGGLITNANIVFFTAEDQHYFADNGINFTSDTYDNGLESISALLNNKVDIAGAAEYPIIANTFAKENISIITSIDKSFAIDILGLTDRGIIKAADLKGKRIGLTLGTINEFYLARFLELNGISINDVTLINMPVTYTVDAMSDGRVDAVVTWDIYETKIMAQHVNKLVTWSVQSSQAAYSVLICRNDWIQQHPDLLKRFVNSLDQAEKFILQHPTEAKANLQKYYNYSDEYIARIWPQNQFGLSLDQSLIAAMEDEARWMIKNNLVTEKEIPFFNDYIYEDALKAIKPEAVNIIR